MRCQPPRHGSSSEQTEHCSSSSDSDPSASRGAHQARLRHTAEPWRKRLCEARDAPNPGASDSARQAPRRAFSARHRAEPWRARLCEADTKAQSAATRGTSQGRCRSLTRRAVLARGQDLKVRPPRHGQNAVTLSRLPCSALPLALLIKSQGFGQDLRCRGFAPQTAQGSAGKRDDTRRGGRDTPRQAAASGLAATPESKQQPAAPTRPSRAQPPHQNPSSHQTLPRETRRSQPPPSNSTPPLYDACVCVCVCGGVSRKGRKGWKSRKSLKSPSSRKGRKSAKNRTSRKGRKSEESRKSHKSLKSLKSRTGRKGRKGSTGPERYLVFLSVRGRLKKSVFPLPAFGSPLARPSLAPSLAPSLSLSLAPRSPPRSLSRSPLARPLARSLAPSPPRSPARSRSNHAFNSGENLMRITHLNRDLQFHLMY